MRRIRRPALLGIATLALSHVTAAQTAPPAAPTAPGPNPTPTTPPAAPTPAPETAPALPPATGTATAPAPAAYPAPRAQPGTVPQTTPAPAPAAQQAPAAYPPPAAQQAPAAYPPPAAQPAPAPAPAQTYYPTPVGAPRYDWPRTRLKYPDDRAVRTIPFVDALAGGVSLSDRYSSFMVLSLQLGTFVLDRVRIAARAGVFAAEADTQNYDIEGVPSDFQAVSETDRPTLLFGGSVGYALASSEGFALSPSLTLLATDASAYGVGVGVTLPFEWVSRRAMRIGFELTVLMGTGGSIRAECQASSFSVTSSGQAPPCDPGEVRDFERKGGSGFYAGFQLGWGMHNPKPVPRNPK